MRVVHSGDDMLALTTENVAVFALDTSPESRVAYAGRTIEVDGDRVAQVVQAGEQYRVCRAATPASASESASESTSSESSVYKWRVCSPEDTAKVVRSPATHGPMGQVAAQPFVIVFGTANGSGDRNQAHAVFLANLFFMQSDTFAPIVADTDLTPTMAAQHNIIAIGLPAENVWVDRAATRLRQAHPASLSFHPNGTAVQLNRCLFRGPDVGVLTLAPHAENRLALIVSGLSAKGLENVVYAATPTIPPMARSPYSNGLGDFLITGRQFAAQGFGGVLCMGLYSHTWAYDVASANCVCD